MVYSYVKDKLDISNPEEYQRLWREAQRDIDRLDEEFCKVWTWCCGCKGYAKIGEAYKGMTDFGPPPERPVLRCGKCHSIWKFLD